MEETTAVTGKAARQYLVEASLLGTINGGSVMGGRAGGVGSVCQYSYD